MPITSPNNSNNVQCYSQKCVLLLQTFYSFHLLCVMKKQQKHINSNDSRRMEVEINTNVLKQYRTVVQFNSMLRIKPSGSYSTRLLLFASFNLSLQFSWHVTFFTIIISNLQLRLWKPKHARTHMHRHTHSTDSSHTMVKWSAFI